MLGQAIGETIFDILYLATALIIGIKILKEGSGKAEYSLFGIMAITLGAGDAFHLIPRCIALFSESMEEYAPLLGTGKQITSITMTIFYILLYKVYSLRYGYKSKAITYSLYLLALIRIILCFMPQNMWREINAPFSWGIYRNIPFALMGAIIIVLFFQKRDDKPYRFMWLAITLSFGFYIPVVLFADTIPIIGMLMIPKTLAYVWVVFMGYNALKQSKTRKA